MKVERKGNGLFLLKSRIEDIHKKQVKVGYFPHATYPTGEPVAYIAAIHEFGWPAGNIAPRSFFRPTIESKGGDWLKMYAAVVKGVIDGGDLESGLAQMGMVVAGDIKAAISNLHTPALLDSTLYARQHRKDRRSSSIKPLIDKYGMLLDSVESTVESK